MFRSAKATADDLSRIGAIIAINRDDSTRLTGNGNVSFRHHRKL